MLKHLRNPLWAMLEYGWYPMLLFIATPWFLHKLGTQQYGHWMLLSATVNFGGILNSGTGAATIKSVSANIGRSADSLVEQTVKRSLAIAILGGGGLAFLVFLIFWFAGPLFLERMGIPSLVRMTGAVAAILLWIEQIDNVFSSSLKGAEHFGLAARIEIASKTAQILAASIALVVYPNLYGLYSALFVVSLLRLIAKTLFAKKQLKLINLTPTFSGSSELLHFAKWGWLQGVGGTLFSVADRMLVGSLLGASSLTYYSIASQLTMQIHAASAAGLSVIFPKVSRKLESQGDFSLGRLAVLTMVANLAMSTVLATGLIIAGPFLLRAWIGESSAAHVDTILPWLTIAYWLLAINVVPYYLLLGMGRMRFVGITVLFAGLFSVTCMYYSSTQFGLIGTPAGRCAYAIVSLALLVPLMQHLLRRR